MAPTPFIGELRIFSFNFPPKGWAFCNGQFLPINQNQPLFSILGTTYGGNGQTTFALPNLKGRAPIHTGTNTLGQSAGEESHTLILNEMAAHNHLVTGSTTPGDANSPAGNFLGTGNPNTLLLYSTGASNLTAMTPTSITNAGGGQPHSNMQPYLVLNVCIALQGVFPSRN